MKKIAVLMLVLTCCGAGSQPVLGSLTPPPKEWAMFPDEPQAPVPAGAQPAVQPPSATGQTAKSGNAPVVANTIGTGGVLSAAVVPAAPKRDLPVLWLALTGLLSMGALLACGNLILKDESVVPVVDEALEVR